MNSAYRLSFTEAVYLIQKERERRRLDRIVQVREQCKLMAGKLRAVVKRERLHLIEKLADQIEENLEVKRDQMAREESDEYNRGMDQIGSGHRAALSQQEESDKNFKLRAEEDSEACARAEKRYQAALREQEQLKTKEHLEHYWHIYSRERVLRNELERAKRLVEGAEPTPDPIELAIARVERRNRSRCGRRRSASREGARRASSASRSRTRADAEEPLDSARSASSAGGRRSLCSDEDEDGFPRRPPVAVTQREGRHTEHYLEDESYEVEKNSSPTRRAVLSPGTSTKLVAAAERVRVAEAEERERRARERGADALRKEHLRHEYDGLVEDLERLQRLDTDRRARAPAFGLVRPAPLLLPRPPLDERQRLLEERVRSTGLGVGDASFLPAPSGIFVQSPPAAHASRGYLH